MKNPIRILRFAAVVAVGVLAFSACSSETDTDPSEPAVSGDKEIAFFTVSNQIPAIVQLADAVAEYFEGEGYTVTVYDAGFNPSTQAQQIEQVIATGKADGAWIFPVSPDTLGPSLELLQSAAIPAVLETSPADFGFEDAQPGLIFSAADFSEYGTAIGEIAAQCATDKGGNEALFLQSVETAGGAAVVISSIEEAFTSGAPEVPIVGTINAADPATAQTAVSQLLIANPEADVVIAGTDETALGAIGAFQAATKVPTCLIAGGGGPDVIAAHEAGDIDAIVAWGYTDGVLTVGPDLLRLIADPTLEGGLFATPISIIE